MRRRAARSAVAVVALLALTLPPTASSAVGGNGFFGVVPQTPLGAGDLARIDRAGLALRVVVPWFEVEPEPGVFDFTGTDRVVGEAARRGIRVLPQVGGSMPSWLAADPARPPTGGRALRAWGIFLRQLVLRYGPGGTLAAQGGLPVRRWQIWNEPNMPLYWKHPAPVAYAKLLHISAAAIRGADPRATIVAAAVAPIEHTIRPWEFLRRLYRVPGVKRDFDVAALHPYAVSWEGIEALVRLTRRVMAEAGDRRTPLLLTELGVASDATEPTAANRGPLGQARFLQASFSRLYANRYRWRIGGVYWYSWKDGAYADDRCGFCQYSGLLDESGDPKPAWWALKRVLARFGSGAVR